MHLKKIYFTAAKYAFSILMMLLAYTTCRDFVILLDGVLELTLVFLLTNLFYDENSKFRKYLVNALSSVFFFIFNLQMLVMYFGGTYISMIMLTNLSSLRDISTDFGRYGLGIAGLLLFSFLPVSKVNIGLKQQKVLLVMVFVLSLVFVSCWGGRYNTAYSLFSLVGQSREYQDLQETVDSGNMSVSEYRDTAPDFFKGGVEDFVSKPEKLPDKPNVIVIFTEGLSQSIVEDPRNLTPNLQEFSKKTLSFDNYYNHTFATYRGLIGQLYSGYQLNNSDTNNLISLQSIFSNYGYNTAFINTEPDNEEFTTYLKSFHFDYLVTDESKATSTEKTLSDKSAYELLFDTCIEMSQSNEPFFTAIYTFGTHVSLNSPDEKFGNGKDAELNKFYNMDYQFGLFLDKFKKSHLADNTLLVFTTDHCTYADQAFRKSFPDVERYHSDIGEILLYLYYDGIEPASIDVKGRNSINFAPTLLDYLDFSSPNFFLGNSLFKKDDDDNLFATVFYDPFNAISTKGGTPSLLNAEEKEEFVKKVTLYLTASKNTRVSTIPLPTEEDAAVVDEGNYFTDGSIDSYYTPYYMYPYVYNYYDYSEEIPEVLEPVPVEPQPSDIPVNEGGYTEPPADNPVVDPGGSDIGGIDPGGGSGEIIEPVDPGAGSE